MSGKIKILYLDNTFTFGGAINSLRHLISAIDKNKFTPILVTGQPEIFLSSHFSDIHYIHYKPKLSWVNNNLYKKIGNFPLFRIRIFALVLNLCRHIYWLLFVIIPEAVWYHNIGKIHNVELIHLNNILGSQLSGILAAKLLRIPCVAHLRDFEEIHPITRFYAWLVDHHIAISSAIKENLLELGVRSDKISVVYDSLDLGEFNADIDCNYLNQEFSQFSTCLRYAIFGRIVDWKGIKEFLLATQLITRTIPNAVGFIVGGTSDGDISFEKEMRQLAESLQISDKVIFTGYRKDIPAMMKFMDIVVHASNRPEPFGMVLIEGMAMCKPVVATKAGGPIDIIDDGNTGYLVRVGDVNELANAITTLLNNSELCKEMGKKGLLRVDECFNSKTSKETIQSIYNAMIYTKKHPGR